MGLKTILGGGSKMEDYLSFLKSKIEIAKESGFDVADSEIHPVLKPHQRDAVRGEEARVPS